MMPPKKTVSPDHLSASSLNVPSVLQTSGLRSVRKVYGRDVDEIRIPSRAERQVVLTFCGVGERRTNIYMDEVLTVIRRREQRTFAIHVPAKAVAKKSTKTAPAKKIGSGVHRAQKATFMTVGGEIRGAKFQTETAAAGNAIRAKVEKGYSLEVKSEKPIIPVSIKKFTLYFFLNIRKLICPKGNVKPNLSAGSAGMVGGLAILIAGHFGIVADVAKAIASAVLILIASATKGSFCDMTAEMAKSAIKKA